MGLVSTIDPDQATPRRLARTIVEALTRPRPEHRIDLDGTRRSLAFVDSL